MDLFLGSVQGVAQRQRSSQCPMTVTLPEQMLSSFPTDQKASQHDIFVIEGGQQLNGVLEPAGNKNGALPILAASLLTDKPVVISNVPKIRDVAAMLLLLQHLGVEIEWISDHKLKLCAANVEEVELDSQLASQIRASFLLAGPLVARFGRAVMSPPGGDVIGRRRLDPHLDAFRALGAEVSVERKIEISAPNGLKPCDFFMDEPSVMATENALMTAALTPGQTVVRNAASEPHVQDLARMLIGMGIQIDGVGSNVMTVYGAESLNGCEHRIAPDHIEVTSFLALAGVTGGDLTVKGCEPGDLRMIRLVFERLGLNTEIGADWVRVPPKQQLKVKTDEGEYQSKVESGPWPAFPADLTSIAVALATQAEGSVLIFEKMFENRLFFTDKLISMGANITLCDPHRAIVIGPSKLRGQRVESPDIRAGMAILIAALCAEGTSEIGNVNQIDRGYESIDVRLRELGAKIERVATKPVSS